MFVDGVGAPVLGCAVRGVLTPESLCLRNFQKGVGVIIICLETLCLCGNVQKNAFGNDRGVIFWSIIDQRGLYSP